MKNAHVYKVRDEKINLRIPASLKKELEREAKVSGVRSLSSYIYAILTGRKK